MKKKLNGLIARWLADLLLVGGAAAVTAGIWMIFPPGGWIAGGVFAILGAILNTGGRGGDG